MCSVYRLTASRYRMKMTTTCIIMAILYWAGKASPALRRRSVKPSTVK